MDAGFFCVLQTLSGTLDAWKLLTKALYGEFAWQPLWSKYIRWSGFFYRTRFKNINKIRRKWPSPLAGISKNRHVNVDKLGRGLVFLHLMAAWKMWACTLGDGMHGVQLPKAAPSVVTRNTLVSLYDICI